MAITPENRYRRPTISEQGGLAAYLDLPEQREKHNNLGYDKWVEFHTTNKKRRSSIAELFNVTVATVRKWERLDTEGQG